MISAPLFGQSVKANWGIWTAVTAATCFILIVIMIAVGGNSINHIMTSIGDAFIKDAVRCEIKSAAMRYYHTASVSIEAFETGMGYAAVPLFTVKGLMNTVTKQITKGAEDRMREKGACEDEAAAAAAAAEDFVRPLLSAYAVQRETLTSEAARSVFITDTVSSLLSETLPEKLLANGMTEPQLAEYLFTPEGIRTIAADAIVDFRARLSIDYPAEVYPGLSEISLRFPDAADTLIESMTASFMSELPDEAQNGMADMQNLELTQIMTGTVFFKIAGLLLPVISIIMVSISLIAGQVDSGSMAYIVSTPIKRGTVALTQSAFLVSSLCLMCLCVAAAGLICLALIGESSISYTQMILLSASSFVTLFTFAGICFLASAWFNRSKHAMAVGGGLSMYFMVATIMGMFGSPEMPSLIRMDAMDFFNRTTIVGLFDSASILANTADFIPRLAVLFAIGLAGFAIGTLRFNRKDLPL